MSLSGLRHHLTPAVFNTVYKNTSRKLQYNIFVYIVNCHLWRFFAIVVERTNLHSPLLMVLIFAFSKFDTVFEVFWRKRSLYTSCMKVKQHNYACCRLPGFSLPQTIQHLNSFKLKRPDICCNWNPLELNDVYFVKYREISIFQWWGSWNIMGCCFIEFRRVVSDDTCMISGVQVRSRGQVKLRAIRVEVLTSDCLTIQKICLK